MLSDSWPRNGLVKGFRSQYESEFSCLYIFQHYVVQFCHSWLTLHIFSVYIYRAGGSSKNWWGRLLSPKTLRNWRADLLYMNNKSLKNRLGSCPSGSTGPDLSLSVKGFLVLQHMDLIIGKSIVKLECNLYPKFQVHL